MILKKAGNFWQTSEKTEESIGKIQTGWMEGGGCMG
jgi:hypothetical protein